MSLVIKHFIIYAIIALGFWIVYVTISQSRAKERRCAEVCTPHPAILEFGRCACDTTKEYKEL